LSAFEKLAILINYTADNSEQTIPTGRQVNISGFYFILIKASRQSRYNKSALRNKTGIKLAFAARKPGKTRGAIGACPPTGGFSLIFCFF
jgi:hypothetical protein